VSLALALAASAGAQLRVACWNITNYSNGRIAEFQTAIYGVVPTPLLLAGQSMSPDVIILQEVLGASQTAGTASLTNFRNMLNTAPGSPGDWTFATFITGPDSKGGLLYRTSKVVLSQDTTIASAGGNSPLPPRNTERWIIRPVGYADLPATRIAIYGSHMKSGDSSDDISRRLVEATNIRTNISTLAPGTHFIVGGDFNIPSSNDPSYQVLTNTNNAPGPLFDPIARPGTWENSNTFRFIHTQDPAAGVQMDSRFDFILLSASLRDGQGMDYIGNPTTPWNLGTFADPNHSYRTWGNDGTSFNTSLNVTSNAMVGNAIAAALQGSALTLGHLPVFLDLRMPPRVAVSQTTIDFGTVDQNSTQQRTFTIGHDGDVTLWTAQGLAPLNYTVPAPPAPFSLAPLGTLVDAPGGASNAHTVTLDTSAVGQVEQSITLSTNAPEASSITLTLRANIVTTALCPNPSNIAGPNQFSSPDDALTADDIIVFLGLYFGNTIGPPTAGNPPSPTQRIADIAGPNQSTQPDGVLTADDIIVFLGRYFQGC
jgi:endonuclease/exonuclease/phosphatase family metal-dependent hydrolase